MNISIEKKADDLLKEFEIIKAPVPIEKIALWLDLEVIPADLGEGVSGVLFIRDGKATIGVNESEHRIRRRFTVAHELGHYILHKMRNELFIDKQMTLGSQMLFRDSESSLGEKRQEREANAFAAAILMPRFMLQREIKDVLEEGQIDSEEELIKSLSKKFDVSQISLTYRMTNLGLI